MAATEPEEVAVAQPDQPVGGGPAQAVGLSAYRHYSGLWRNIDEEDYYKLTQREDVHAFINEKQQGVTPLHLATLKKNTNIMQFLLSNGADPNLISRNRAPLYLATLYGEDLMVILLLQHGADPNMLVNNVAPLHIAAAKGIIELCELLIQYGADVNLVAPRAGTPLHVAVSRDHRFITEGLLKHDPNLNVVNHHGETVLHMAARLGHLEIVEKLLARRKSINPTIKEFSEGNTPLHLAAMNKHDKIAKLIAQAFPELLIIKNDGEGKTPLFYMSGPQRRSLRESYASRRENFLVKAYNTQKNLADLVLLVKDFSEDPNAEPTWLEIPCHKVVVWPRCRGLQKLISTYNFEDVARPGTPLSLSGSFDGSARQAQKIRIDDFPYQVMEPLIYYLYSDIIRCKRPHLADLQKAANHFGLERLATLCDVELGIFNASANTTSTLKADLATMIDNKMFSDVLLQIEDTHHDAHADEWATSHEHSRNGEFYAHRALLSAASEYFRTMFEISLSERTSPQVDVKQTPPRVLRSVIRWIYGEPVTSQDLTPETAVDMLELSTRFMLDSLSYQVQDYLCKRVDDTNIFELLKVADMLHTSALLEECLDYVCRMPNAHKAPEWEDIPESIRDQVIQVGVAMMSKPRTKVLPPLVVASPSGDL